MKRCTIAIKNGFKFFGMGFKIGLKFISTSSRIENDLNKLS
jgi:hypothetical protein